jgi:hypothetical protein
MGQHTVYHMRESNDSKKPSDPRALYLVDKHCGMALSPSPNRALPVDAPLQRYQRVVNLFTELEKSMNPGISISKDRPDEIIPESTHKLILIAMACLAKGMFPQKVAEWERQQWEEGPLQIIRNRPANPYTQFADHMRPQLQADNYPPTHIGHRILQEWEYLSAEHRSEWEDHYTEQMKEYDQAMDMCREVFYPMCCSGEPAWEAEREHCYDCTCMVWLHGTPRWIKGLTPDAQDVVGTGAWICDGGHVASAAGLALVHGGTAPWDDEYLAD